MTLAEFWLWLENLPLALRIGESWWFPLLESLHVVAITFVVGAILMVDLRLLNLAARRYSVSRIAGELVPWTWGAFVISVLTGAGLFITRAEHYAGNAAFQIKIILLVLAGINMAALHFIAFRNVAKWDTAVPTTSAARIAGAASLLLWMGVMLAGRWIGHLTR
ncbi:MAG: hypothetical protein H7Y02_13385 [Candidatus Obscuribacterales bacterium]|nr:hypothetical protein [Steroidobacteraceae bacterium]